MPEKVYTYELVESHLPEGYRPDPYHLNGPEDGLYPSDVVLMMGESTGSVVYQKTAGDNTGLQASSPWPKLLLIDQRQGDALERILERDRTARYSHDGLRGLLGISDDDVKALSELVQALKR